MQKYSRNIQDFSKYATFCLKKKMVLQKSALLVEQAKNQHKYGTVENVRRDFSTYLSITILI